MVHRVRGTTVLGEESSRAVVEPGIGLLGREGVVLAGRRAILAPLWLLVNARNMAEH